MRKHKALWALGMVSVLAVLINATYPTITVNNRFVIYVVIVCINIMAIIYVFLKQQLLRNLLLMVVGMVGFAFLLVPLYDVFCEVTGLNGKMDLSIAAAGSEEIDYSREITVEFVVTQNRDMPWEFKPKHKSMVVHPGQLASTAYYAKNISNRTMYAQAIPSITPSFTRKHFKKIECFCFSKQKLGPGETAYLGLRFYLDPKIPKNVQRISLAYTIFDITAEVH